MTGAAPKKDRPVVIEVHDLVTHYGARMILKGVSMEVRDGEIMVIMGGSGSGKSTLLRHLMVLERATSGTMKVLGQDITQLGLRDMIDLRKKLGVAFQGGALFSSMTVGENIMLPLYEHTDLDPQTMRIMARMKLEVVNLAGFEDLMPSELSGGMIKRAAVARAIIMDPRILFMDEPSAGLDPAVSSALDDLILRLRDAMGMSICVVTHELESAFKIADRVTGRGADYARRMVAGYQAADEASLAATAARWASFGDEPVVMVLGTPDGGPEALEGLGLGPVTVLEPLPLPVDD